MSSKTKRVIEEDKSDPIKWAQPRKQTALIEYKPATHYRADDIQRFRDIPSLVTGRRM